MVGLFASIRPCLNVILEVIKVWSVYFEGTTAFYPQGIDVNIRDKVNLGYQYFGSTVQALTYTYLKGSKITRDAKDEVTFVNSWLPAGVVIARWDLAYLYTTGRTVPALPILQPNQQYALNLVAELDQPHGVLLRLLFFDYSGQLIHQKTILPLRGRFTYPAKAAFYALELVNTGIKQMQFHRIDIVPLAKGADLATINFDNLFKTNRQDQQQRQRVIENYLS